ncbi:MAG: succinyl-diaminopimelate desuccinylase, partial [Actinomycetes bacterium]
MDLGQDGPTLAAALVDVYSVSGSEGALADAVQVALTGLDHLRVDRDGDAVVARTSIGRAQRVVLAGHLDTVPEAGNFPGRRDGGVLHGLGACDMKGGVAVALRLAASLPDPGHDVTYVFYDGEEVEEPRNGLRRLAERHPDWLTADLAVLMEPSGATVEAGCQGSLRVRVRTEGRRAHSARSWTGVNAIHAAAPVLDRLRAYEPRRVLVDGLEYREGLNAVRIAGGVAGNVIPDECTVTVNYRFAPDRTLDEAEDHTRKVFDGFEVERLDGAAGARPGLDAPAVLAFLAAVGGQPRPKFGWTDVARFAALGIPAVNYGPGEPELAHTREE